MSRAPKPGEVRSEYVRPPNELSPKAITYGVRAPSPRRPARVPEKPLLSRRSLRGGR